MARKRILLVGAGRWGKVYLRNLEKHGRLAVSGLVTSQAKQALAHLEKDTALFGSLPEALRSGGWDGVILATPPETHADQLRLCLAEGLPVIVEKPLTLALAEAEELAELPEAGDVLVDHIFLFHSGFVKLKELLLDAGPVRKIVSEGGNFGPFRTYSPLWDYGAHDLSMILDLLGESPRAIKASVKDQGEREGGLAGDYSVQMEFSSGVFAAFRASNLSPTKIRRITVETDQERFVLDDLPRPSLSSQSLQGGAVEQVQPASFSPLDGLLNAFCEGLEGRKDGRWGLQLGRRVVETLTACERAIFQA